MKRAVVMSTFRRDPVLLENSLRSVRRALPDDPILMVDDGSGRKYRKSVAGLYRRYDVTEIETDTLALYPDAFHLENGHNNSVHASNTGIDAARELGAEAVLFVCSDVMVSANLGRACDEWDPLLSEGFWTAQVFDLSGGALGGFPHYCSPLRPFPFQWCEYVSMAAIDAVGGGMDLAYLRGLAFEDNDFCGSLAYHHGKFFIDTRVVAVHQEHPLIYTDAGQIGCSINHTYCRAKWGEVPFNDVPARCFYDRGGVFGFTLGGPDGGSRQA